MEKVNNFLNHVLPKILSVILVFLIFTSMIDSNLIQGCARVVNYTASVRGGSQRIVKFVIMGQPYSDLINESEIILNAASPRFALQPGTRPRLPALGGVPRFSSLEMVVGEQCKYRAIARSE